MVVSNNYINQEKKQQAEGAHDNPLFMPTALVQLLIPVPGRRWNADYPSGHVASRVRRDVGTKSYPEGTE